jgi:hypothetical protein
MSTRGEGERVFEEWAVQHGVRIKRIRETHGKRPDYWLMCPGGACVVEVKDLAPNCAEKAFDRELDLTGHALHFSTPGDRLRPRLSRANQKYACWAKRGIPCLTFVFNNTSILSSTSAVHVFAAMFGGLSFSVPIADLEEDTNVIGLERDTKVIAEKGLMTRHWNTSTSAVGANEWDYATG